MMLIPGYPQVGQGAKRAAKNASGAADDEDNDGPQAEASSELTDLEATPKPAKKAKTKGNTETKPRKAAQAAGTKVSVDVPLLMLDVDATQAGKGAQAGKTRKVQARKGTKRGLKDVSDEAEDGPQVEESSALDNVEVTPKPPRKKAKTKEEKAEEKANGLRKAIQATRAAQSSAPTEARDAPNAPKSTVRDRNTTQAHGSASAAVTS